jgi:hypothetical protein
MDDVLAKVLTDTKLSMNHVKVTKETIETVR